MPELVGLPSQHAEFIVSADRVRMRPLEFWQNAVSQMEVRLQLHALHFSQAYVSGERVRTRPMALWSNAAAQMQSNLEAAGDSVSSVAAEPLASVCGPGAEAGRSCADGYRTWLVQRITAVWRSQSGNQASPFSLVNAWHAWPLQSCDHFALPIYSCPT